MRTQFFRSILPQAALSLAIVTIAGFGSQSLAAPEKRCGWIQNPTPGNYWLDDASGTWIIRFQGSTREPRGMDRIGDVSSRDYVRTNGNYGYACTCMTVDTGKRDGLNVITAIHSVTQLPLARCRADKALPKPD